MIEFKLLNITGTWIHHQSFTPPGPRMFGVHSSLRRLSQSSSDEEGPPPASSGAARVKRALFGPTDHEENLRFVKNELKKARSEASSRWNFDFDSGRPLSGQYDWEEVESSTASRTICNPEKHELLAPGPAEKENRVTSCDSVEAGAGETDQPRPDARSRVSVEAAGRLTSDSLDTSDSPGTPSTPPGPSAASAASTASSLPPSHLGARHKTTLSKEKKLTGNVSIGIFFSAVVFDILNYFRK